MGLAVVTFVAADTLFEPRSAGFDAASRLVQQVGVGLTFALTLVGGLSQLRNPDRNIAGMQQLGVMSIVAGITVSDLTGSTWPAVILVGFTAVAVVAHPRRGELLRPPMQPWLGGFAIVAVAILPLLGAAGAELARGFEGAESRVGTWAAMGALFLGLIALAVLSVIRPPGYQVPGFSLAAAVGLYGLASLAEPYDPSAQATWGWFPIVWSAVWIVYLVLWPRRKVDETPKVIELEATRLERALRFVGVAAVVVGAFLFTVAWAYGGETPNVPHTLTDRAGTELTFAQADAASCLTCHFRGREGAPPVRHASTRRCGIRDVVECWGGRSDCVGCHRVSPDLGGSEELVVLTKGVDTDPRSELDASGLSALRDHSRR